MADRKDWYFRQIVAEDELDSAFTELEQADRDIVKDLGLGEDVDNKAEFGGVTDGFAISIVSASSRTIQIAIGTAYDKDGQRINQDSTMALTLTNIGVTDVATGGTPDGASTDVSSGKEKWLAIYIAFDRLLSDARLDGSSQQIYFERDESYHFEVTAGAEGTAPIADPSSAGATRQDGKILLADIKIKNDGFSTYLDSVDTTRRERFFSVTGSPQSIAKDNLRDVLKQLLENYNAHVSDTIDQHTLAGLAYSGGPAWADGTANPPTDVEAHLDAVIRKLADTTDATDSPGAAKIGAGVSVGLVAAPDQSAPVDLAAGTLEAQLLALQVAVNGRVFRGDDNAVGDLLPNVTGKVLGSTIKRWDTFLRDINISGSVTGDILPAAGSQDVGSTIDRWNNVYASGLNIAGATSLIGAVAIGGAITPDTNNAYDVGSSSFRFKDGYFTGDLRCDDLFVDVVDANSLQVYDLNASLPVNNFPPQPFLSLQQGSLTDTWMQAGINELGHIVEPKRFTEKFQQSGAPFTSTHETFVIYTTGSGTPYEAGDYAVCGGGIRLMSGTSDGDSVGAGTRNSLIPVSMTDSARIIMAATVFPITTSTLSTRDARYYFGLTNALPSSSNDQVEGDGATAGRDFLGLIITYGHGETVPRWGWAHFQDGYIINMEDTIAQVIASPMTVYMQLSMDEDVGGENTIKVWGKDLSGNTVGPYASSWTGTSSLYRYGYFGCKQQNTDGVTADLVLSEITYLMPSLSVGHTGV